LARTPKHLGLGALLATVLLSGCATQPATVVADDDAFCRYSESVEGAQPYTECRKKLESQRNRKSALSATYIEGYALLPGAPEPKDVAGRCKTAPNAQDCPADDVTGSIPSQPKR
jgi:hypothetical protein